VSARTCAAILAALLVSSFPVSTARAGDSLLVLRSDPGDWLGQGQTLIFGRGQGAFTTFSQPRMGLRGRFAGSGHQWTIEAARGRQLRLARGIHGLTAESSTGDTIPKLSVHGDGSGCGHSSGYFDVRDIGYDAGGIARRMHVVFEYHCDGAAPALSGELRIDTDTTILVNAPLRARARRGQALQVDVAAAHAAGLPLVLSAEALPSGAAFVDQGNGTGRLTWTPALNQQGDYAIGFAATDGTGDSAFAHTLVRVDGDTLLDVTSEPGDRAWLGRNCRLRPGDMLTIFNTSDGYGAGTVFVPHDAGIGIRYFSIHPTRPGNYSVLRRWSEDAFASGTFVASPAPGGCAMVVGDYRVRRAELRLGVASALWVEWVQHCDGELPAFRGEIRINAGSPIVVRAPIAHRVHFGDTLRFEVTGRDTLGRPLALSGWQLPPGCTLTPTGPASAELSWCPPEAAAGAHTLMFRAVNDAGEADTVGTDVVVTGDVSATFESEPGDPAGAGGALDYAGEPGVLTASLVSDPGLGTIDLIKVLKPGHSSWEIRMRDPRGQGLAIVPGRYSAPWVLPYGGIYFGASRSTGQMGYERLADFRIRQLLRTSSGHPKRLWMEFEQRSEGRMPALRGEVRLDARWRILARAPLRRSATWSEPDAFEVRGETPDGEIPVVSCVALPPGALFTPTAPGKATFRWVAQQADVGSPRTVAFVATRADGATDTTLTILESLAAGALHLEEGERTWELHSGLGQFRLWGGASWARATFSSPSADTLWALTLSAGYGDTLRTQTYIVDYPGSSYYPYVCMWTPGIGYSPCQYDTGRFEVARLERTASGEPSVLWADFAHAYGEGSRKAGWFQVYGTGVVGAPPPSGPAACECSQFLPNPAARARRLELRLPRAGRVAMAVFDIAGRRVREYDWATLESGPHVLPLPDLATLVPGLYLARIEYDGLRVVRRLGVLR